MNPSPGTVNTDNFCNILRHQENEEQHSVNVTDPACCFILKYCYFDSVEEIQHVQASRGQNWSVGRAPRIYCTSSPGSNDRTAQEGNLSVSHIEFTYAG